MSELDRIPMAAPALQYRALRDEIDTAVQSVFESGFYMLGPECQALEHEIASLSGVPYGLGVNSGTDALALALAALGIGEGDEVITTALTFFATAEVISNLGAVPVFVDVDRSTFNLDARRIEAAITPRTRAIMPVHLFGQMADMIAIMTIAHEHQLAVVEDAAQAIGASFGGQAAGSFSDATGFSFFPTKNLAACGDGGMVVTPRADVAESVRRLRFHGSGGSSVYEQLGACSRLDEVQAAILRVKLRHLDAANERRRGHAERYDAVLANTSVFPPYRDPRAVHVFHHYTVRTPFRDDLQAFLSTRGIDSRIYYEVPLHRQPVYADLGYQPGVLRHTEELSREVLSLPVYAEMTDDQQSRVVDALAEFGRSR